MNFWQTLTKPIKILAPMDDVTDAVFRKVILKLGRPDVFFTEFTSADGLCSKGVEKVARRLEYDPAEQPIVAQIWGNKPENYGPAVKMVKDMGFSGVDINMGCPANKVIRRGECSGLIENPSLAKELVRAAQEAAGEMPVSVKTRIGLSKVVTEEWIGFLLELDLAALTVHGRTAKQKSLVPADWDEIAKAVRLRDQMGKDTIIIGNGDVQDLEDIQLKAEKYPVDGAMVGRGIFNDPFLFNPNKSITDLSPAERGQIYLEHVKLFEQMHGGKRPPDFLKKFMKTYITGFDGAAEWRAQIAQVRTFTEFKQVLSRA